VPWPLHEHPQNSLPTVLSFAQFFSSLPNIISLRLWVTFILFSNDFIIYVERIFHQLHLERISVLSANLLDC
jgi:hypothetical protein